MRKIVLLVMLGLAATLVVKPQTAFRLFLLKKYAEPLYRKPTKNELQHVAPDRNILQTYKDFLKTSGTGLTRLIADSGCAENSNVISASETCRRYSMPGGGSSFSFRTRNYRIARLADITFTRGSFQATGALLHGVFVNLGDVPLEQLALDSKGLEFISKFKPPQDYLSAKRADEIMSTGFVYRGIVHRRALYIKENATFVLRSIAYRGRLYRSVGGITYNELVFDKRRDTIVAFRIVKMGDDGSLTILWKILSEQKSPKLKRKKR